MKRKASEPETSALESVVQDIIEVHNATIDHIKVAVENKEEIVTSMIGMSHLLGIQTKQLEQLVSLVLPNEDQEESRIGFLS